MLVVIIILVAIIVYALLSAGKKKDGSTNQDGTMKETIKTAFNANGLTPVRMLPVGRTSIVGEYYAHAPCDDTEGAEQPARYGCGFGVH